MSAAGPVVVAGEALVDLVAEDARRLRAHPGGGPFNAARSVARLGRPVAFVGGLSSDGFGVELRRALVADGVGVDLAPETADPTTLAVAEVAPDGGASYVFYRRGTSAAALTEADVAGLGRLDVAVLLTGGVALALEPAGATLESLALGADDRTLVVLDPNVRPAAVADEAAYRGRLERVLRRVDVVKASEEDLAWWLRADPAGAARELLGRGPRAVVVTRGARGATVVTREAAVDVVAPAARVRDTIGAGDAFAGAFAAWWQRHALGRERADDLPALRAAASFANLVAARTCERDGADPPHIGELGAEPWDAPGPSA